MSSCSLLFVYRNTHNACFLFILRGGFWFFYLLHKKATKRNKKNKKTRNKKLFSCFVEFSALFLHDYALSMYFYVRMLFVLSFFSASTRRIDLIKLISMSQNYRRSSFTCYHLMDYLVYVAHHPASLKKFFCCLSDRLNGLMNFLPLSGS